LRSPSNTSCRALRIAPIAPSTYLQAALDLMHQTRLVSTAEFDAYTAALSKRKNLHTYGFVGANATHMGPMDSGWTDDDDSACAGTCGRHGFCRESTCVCVSLWEGPTCNLPKAMPAGMTAAFDGHHVLNREHLREIPDLTLRYTTNPKARDFLAIRVSGL